MCKNFVSNDNNLMLPRTFAEQECRHGYSFIEFWYEILTMPLERIPPVIPGSMPSDETDENTAADMHFKHANSLSVLLDKTGLR